MVRQHSLCLQLLEVAYTGSLFSRIFNGVPALLDILLQPLSVLLDLRLPPYQRAALLKQLSLYDVTCLFPAKQRHLCWLDQRLLMVTLDGWRSIQTLQEFLPSLVADVISDGQSAG